MIIRKLFNQRTQRKFKTENNADQWVTDILNSNNTTEYYITSKSLDDMDTLSDINSILNKGFYISAVFNCGNIYTNRNEKAGLFIFDKNKPTLIKLGNKELQSYDGKNNQKGQVLINKDLPKDYRQYIYEIETWINNNCKPKDLNKFTTFCEIPYEKYLSEINLNPLYYMRKYSNSHIERTAKLSDYANIIYPKSLKKLNDLKDMRVKIIEANSYNFHDNGNNRIEFKDLPLSRRTDTELCKNDILINSEGKIYFHNIEKYKTPVYISENNQVVIRAKKNNYIPALYCILKEDNNLNFNNISPEMPVIKIQENIDYETYFNILIGKKHKYLSVDKADENLLQQINICAYKQMEEVIKKDLYEIDLCYNNKAYKAAIILCGSVLEAFLYDWLKERKIKIEKEWTLKDYIDQIEELYQPQWLKSAEKAQEIRHKRNYIHPKKYIEKNTLIDKKLCDDIKKYLKDVICTRNDLRT